MSAPYSSGLTFFLSFGTFADRPVSLNIHPDLFGLRYEYDTGLIAWNNNTLDWDQLTGLTTAAVAGSNGDIQINSSGAFGALTPGSGISTFLATPSSANLRAALTDEVGTGAAYFVGGALGTPASGAATNLTSIPVAQATGVLPAVNGGAGTVSGVLKANGSGTVSAAAAGTDYAAAPSGSANTPLFNNGSGGFTNGTRSGNTTAVATVSGSLTTGNVAAFDASGNIVDGGTTPGSSGGGFSPTTKTADYTILSGDNGTDFNNDGAGGDVVLSLPAAVPPLVFSGSVHAAHYIKFLADGTDIIAVGPDPSAAGGFVRNNVPYNHIELRCAIAGKWYAASFIGNWGIDL